MQPLLRTHQPRLTEIDLSGGWLLRLKGVADDPIVWQTTHAIGAAGRASQQTGIPFEVPSQGFYLNLPPLSAEDLAFLGRICPEKRPDRAIEIARRTGVPLKIAAKVDRVGQEYFEAVVRPLLGDPLVEFVGGIGEREKAAFLGHARAVLLPIDWTEPFGLVMIEAMACGTPVIAWRRGLVPEVIEHGRTDFLVDDLAAAIRAVAQLDDLDRQLIRARFEQRFSAERMAKDYLGVYRSLASEAVLPAPAEIGLSSSGARVRPSRAKPMATNALPCGSIEPL